MNSPTQFPFAEGVFPAGQGTVSSTCHVRLVWILPDQGLGSVVREACVLCWRITHGFLNQ
jgi:hypothetical protein